MCQSYEKSIYVLNKVPENRFEKKKVFLFLNVQKRRLVYTGKHLKENFIFLTVKGIGDNLLAGITVKMLKVEYLHTITR